MTIQELKEKAAEIADLTGEVDEEVKRERAAAADGQYDWAATAQRRVRGLCEKLGKLKGEYAALCMAHVEAQFDTLP